MKSKNLFLIAVLVMFGFSTMAQQGEGLSFGLRGGVNFQNINGKDISGDKLENDLLTGFNAGVVVQIPVAPEFYFQPGLLFTTKGAKSDNFQGSGIAVELNPSYIELPLNLLYKPLLGKGHMLLGFGPYVAYGIGGKATLGNDEFDIEYVKDYSSALPYGQYLKPLDYGANLFFGYELANGISAQLNTQFGLAEINAKNTNPLYTNSEASFKNTGFGISIGYMF